MSDINDGEVVMLRDSNGDYYVISREVLDRGKLEGDLQEAVAEAAEAEVSGFAFTFGTTQFQSTSSTDFSVIGSFTYQQPAGVKISKTLLPGR